MGVPRRIIGRETRTWTCVFSETFGSPALECEVPHVPSAPDPRAGSGLCNFSDCFSVLHTLNCCPSPQPLGPPRCPSLTAAHCEGRGHSAAPGSLPSRTPASGLVRHPPGPPREPTRLCEPGSVWVTSALFSLGLAARPGALTLNLGGASHPPLPQPAFLPLPGLGTCLPLAAGFPGQSL